LAVLTLPFHDRSCGYMDGWHPQVAVDERCCTLDHCAVPVHCSRILRIKTRECVGRGEDKSRQSRCLLEGSFGSYDLATSSLLLSR
jgi:hypothetical protein